MFIYNILDFIILYFFNRCSVFLIDKETKELVAEVFDGISTNNKEVPREHFICLHDYMYHRIK